MPGGVKLPWGSISHGGREKIEASSRGNNIKAQTESNKKAGKTRKDEDAREQLPTSVSSWEIASINLGKPAQLRGKRGIPGSKLSHVLMKHAAWLEKP